MAWSPYIIEVVLHHHCSCAPFPRDNAPAYRPCVDELMAAGVLEVGSVHFTTTPLGKALVALWCETPLPVATFVDPRFTARPASQGASNG